MLDKQKRPRLSKRELAAILEALNARLAGDRDNEDDPDAPTTEDYESASGKIAELLAKRTNRSRAGGDRI